MEVNKETGAISFACVNCVKDRLANSQEELFDAMTLKNQSETQLFLNGQLSKGGLVYTAKEGWHREEGVNGFFFVGNSIVINSNGGIAKKSIKERVMIKMERVGNKIKELRQKKGITQDGLAEILFITRQAVSRWEMGQSMPSIDNVIDLMRIFECSFETILCLKEKEE